MNREELEQLIRDVLRSENSEYSEIAELDPAVDEATESSFNIVAAPQDTQPQTMDQFLTAVLTNVDSYWSATFAAEGLPEPSVSYLWPGPGEVFTTGCFNPDGNEETTDDDTAAYCRASDTIFISQQFAYDLWSGYIDTVYGPQSGTMGDFAVAYSVAHEFGHSIQAELGISPVDFPIWQLELMADCFAGNWANSAYYQGILQAGDIEEALTAANLIGDYEYEQPGHHGTPEERVAAFKLGYDNGNPPDCFVFLGTE